MKSALRPHHQALILALILLIHGSILLLFIAMEFQSGGQREAVVLMEEQPENSMTERDWVALNNSLPNAQMMAQEPTVDLPQQEQELPENETPIEQTEQDVPQEKNLQKQEIQEQEIDEAIALASQFLEQTTSKESEQEKEKKEEVPQEKVQPITQITATTPRKQTPNFAQLAQGFVEHLQQADMAVQSNRSGTASIDQIKHINYCQKIIGCIVTAYKINNHTAPFKGMLPQRARLHVALNRNGSIAQLILQQSSGNGAVDRFLLEMFKEASSSFPPVPAALTENPYHLPTFSIDSLESFHSTAGWYIDNKSS